MTISQPGTSEFISMRVGEIEKMKLATGAHKRVEDGACAMELVSWIAGEPFSDHPNCVSFVIGAFVRRFNDRLNDEDRQKLKPYLPRIIGTAASPKIEVRRSYLAVDWSVRVHAPMWLDAAELTENAQGLRVLAIIDSPEAAKGAQPVIRQAREAAYKARSAAASAYASDSASAYAYDAAASADAAAAAAVASPYASYASDSASASASASYASADKRKELITKSQAMGFELLDRLIASSAK